MPDSTIPVVVKNPAGLDADSLHLHEASLDVDFGDGIGWSAWHGWVDGITTWVDGTIVAAGKRSPNYLDIGCFGDDCCMKEEWRPLAEAAWAAGSVLAVEPYDIDTCVVALILPTPALSTELIDTAVRRFHA